MRVRDDRRPVSVRRVAVQRLHDHAAARALRQQLPELAQLVVRERLGREDQQRTRRRLRDRAVSLRPRAPLEVSCSTDGITPERGAFGGRGR